jgi:hypothetical protein
MKRLSFKLDARPNGRGDVRAAASDRMLFRSSWSTKMIELCSTQR